MRPHREEFELLSLDHRLREVGISRAELEFPSSLADTHVRGRGRGR